MKLHEVFLAIVFGLCALSMAAYNTWWVTTPDNDAPKSVDLKPAQPPPPAQ